MGKIDQAKEKQLRNEAYADRFKKKDRATRKSERRSRTAAMYARIEAAFWAAEAKRRQWPVGHKKNAL